MLIVVATALMMLAPVPTAAADVNFKTWLASLWPDAQRLGISRATFDAATQGLKPNLKLPDLDIPGRPKHHRRAQAEFVSTPAEYLKESRLRNLARYGRKLAAKHRDTLKAIEKRFGVPGEVVLAIWGRETDFGRYRLPHNALRVLATQGYTGKRKDQFRTEFLYAMKLLEDGNAKMSDMRSSWAGAMGLTQFLPSELYKHGVDMDRDGRIDIWHSVPDALASAAKQLHNKGWQTGKRWSYEAHLPKRGIDCTIAEPNHTRPLAEWLEAGYKPTFNRKPSPEELDAPTSLILPSGLYGPAFLISKNYFVIKDYNFSDLYVLFVGSLADRIATKRGFEIPWGRVTQMRTKHLEEMQRHLAALGYYKDKIDGKAGMKTRAAVGAFQKKQRLKLDCWPTQATLKAMRKKTGSK
ncbi:MAG: lytic murein transglycosylase [Alphaproteobacteria bacterium]